MDQLPTGQLSRLVHTRRQERGHSLRDLAALCPPMGNGKALSRQWISRLENDLMIEAPLSAELKALAIGLGLRWQTVKFAMFAQYYETHPVLVPHPDQPGVEVELIIGDVEDMTLEQRQALVRSADDARRHARPEAL